MEKASRAKILVIDDELFYRELVADILTKAKHEVVQAKDGREALDAIEKRRDFDLVLADVVMPDLNGLVVLSKVKEKDDSIPVIMLSAHEDQRMVIQAMRRGAFDYQKKPISAQELELAVKRALDFRKLHAEQQRKLERLAIL
jgi:two-component system response regulator AtoC